MEDPQKYVFKGVWIPKEIWEAGDITWMEKCLLAEINALDDGKKGCFASNEFLAQKFSTSPASIANQISKLRSLHYIETIAFDGRERRMRVKADLIRQLRQGSLGNLVRFHSQVEALIRERKGEPKEEPEPLSPQGGGCVDLLENATSIQSKRDLSEGFELFWKAYPKKEKKDKALAAWKRKRCCLIQEEIMLALGIHKTSNKWTKKNGTFIPYPTTWINGGEWQNEINDTPEPAAVKTKKGF